MFQHRIIGGITPHIILLYHYSEGNSQGMVSSAQSERVCTVSCTVPCNYSFLRVRSNFILLGFETLGFQGLEAKDWKKKRAKLVQPNFRNWLEESSLYCWLPLLKRIPLFSCYARSWYTWPKFVPLMIFCTQSRTTIWNRLRCSFNFLSHHLGQINFILLRNIKS